MLYFGKEFTEAFIETLKESLSPLEDHVLYLHLLGTDYKTIAELLGKSPKTIDNALQRVKAKAEKVFAKRIDNPADFIVYSYRCVRRT